MASSKGASHPLWTTLFSGKMTNGNITVYIVIELNIVFCGYATNFSLKGGTGAHENI